MQGKTLPLHQDGKRQVCRSRGVFRAGRRLRIGVSESSSRRRIRGKIASTWTMISSPGTTLRSGSATRECPFKEIRTRVSESLRRTTAGNTSPTRSGIRTIAIETLLIYLSRGSGESHPVPFAFPERFRQRIYPRRTIRARASRGDP
jgi:hypothetical protein